MFGVEPSDVRVAAGTNVASEGQRNNFGLLELETWRYIHLVIHPRKALAKRIRRWGLRGYGRAAMYVSIYVCMKAVITRVLTDHFFYTRYVAVCTRNASQEFGA